MSDKARALLRDHFGYDEFKPGQEEVVDHLLAGRSAAAVFPTGGGKSVCYQLPAMALPGVTLVVSPLIALMKDQIDALSARGVAAQRLDSTLGADAYREAMARIRSGDLKLLYVAPERFSNEMFRQALGRLRVSLFAVDEAHCISEWGHNFRPDYLKLAKAARDARAERLLALTATATPKVLQDVCRAFEIAPECAIRTSLYRPNLKLLLTSVEESSRDAQLLQRLRDRPAGSTIVYVTKRSTAEEVAANISRAGLDVRAYHAGLDSEERTRVQDWFIRSTDGIVVATIAFGMGIDKADIRYVYHYNLPKSLEGYSQEVGRAGRDGEDATCEVLACTDDLTTLESFIAGDTPTASAIRSFIGHVLTAGDEICINLHQLSRDNDIRPIVGRTLLTYLELLGCIKGGTPHYASYRFQPKMSSDRILADFQGERREFLSRLLPRARKAKTWFKLDVEAAADGMRISRDRIVAAIDFLSERGMLKVQATDLRYRYHRVKPPEDLDGLIERICRRVEQREAGELARLRQVVDLVEHDGCQVAALAEHFGEARDPCGHCSWCLRKGSDMPAAKRRRAPVEEAVA